MDALETSWNREVYALFMEMGTGKTKVLIDNMSMLYDNGKIDGALIIAPKGVMGTWYRQELPTHLVDHVENKAVMWQSNITKSQSRLLGNLFKTGEELHILIMNVEAFSTEKGVDFAKKFLSCHNTLMVIDESTTIKNPSAKRTKNILNLSTKTKYRRIMTGSPVTKNPLDLYSQCEFLSSWLLDFTSYYAFRNRYAEMKTMYVRGRTIQVVDKFKNLGELSEQLKGFSYRVLKEDCLDLPEKNWTKRQITLTPDQRKIYIQMKETALAMLNGKQATTMTVLTQLMRLHQITCGHFTADDGTIQRIDNNRVNELMNILSEMENTNKSFKEVLTKAQSLGYAETNPKNDLNGNDVLSKIRILSSLSFNTKISKNVCLMDGIENIDLKDIKIASELNLRIKLLGITELLNNKLFERVHPCLVGKETYIGNINGVMNAVILNGKPIGETVLQGEGAGPGPTSSALLSDLFSVLRGNIKYPFGIPYGKRKTIKSYVKDNYANSLYLRFEVKDKPGVLSEITKKTS